MAQRLLSAPALGLNTIIFKHVYWYMQQISGERLQDHWSSCFKIVFNQLMLSFNAVNKELMCKICIKYEYVSRAVCAYAHDFQK